MLKGQVFARQLFENQIFALFIDTFLNGKNGVSNNYKNSMEVTASGSNVTIQSGAVCIRGRFLEESSSTTLNAGTDNAYCRLVIEVDLDKVNTDTSFLQGAYKIIKGTTNYPNLTQTNIVKNNSGVYQYELARFQTSVNGISNFTDTRTFLDFDSIYSAMQREYRSILEDLEEELQKARNDSYYSLKQDVFYQDETNIFEPLLNDSYSGYVTGGGRDIIFTIPLPKKVNFEALYNVQSLKLSIRCHTGYIESNSFDFATSMSDIKLSPTGESLQITLSRPTGWGTTNNIPVNVGVGGNGGIKIAIIKPQNSDNRYDGPVLMG